MLSGEELDVVILATPIHTHGPLARAALHAGADVYLEKPPAASLAEFESIRDAAKRTGRRVQIGFQSFGSHAMHRLQTLIASGELGSIRSITATGLWTRPRAYFARSRWAGKRRLDGVDVVDGVVTNPLAHAVATGLALAGSTGDVDSIETELYRANAIESDDTSAVRVYSSGLPITCLFTLCAETSIDPFVSVHGDAGTAVLHYTRDELQVPGSSVEAYGRDDLLEDLLDQGNLLSPIEHHRAFMQVVEAIRTAEDPTPIPDSCLNWVPEDDDYRAVVLGIDELIGTAGGKTFSELGAPWAR